jgi:hypothetical protein
MMKIMPILSRFQKIRNWKNQQSKSYDIGQQQNSAVHISLNFLERFPHFMFKNHESVRKMAELTIKHYNPALCLAQFGPS